MAMSSNAYFLFLGHGAAFCVVVVDLYVRGDFLL